MQRLALRLAFLAVPAQTESGWSRTSAVQLVSGLLSGACCSFEFWIGYRDFATASRWIWCLVALVERKDAHSYLLYIFLSKVCHCLSRWKYHYLEIAPAQANDWSLRPDELCVRKGKQSSKMGQDFGYIYPILHWWSCMCSFVSGFWCVYHVFLGHWYQSRESQQGEGTSYKYRPFKSMEWTAMISKHRGCATLPVPGLQDGKWTYQCYVDPTCGSTIFTTFRTLIWIYQCVNHLFMCFNTRCRVWLLMMLLSRRVRNHPVAH